MLQIISILRIEKSNAEEKAAVKIQAIARGRKSRRQVSQLRESRSALDDESSGGEWGAVEGGKHPQVVAMRRQLRDEPVRVVAVTGHDAGVGLSVLDDEDAASRGRHGRTVQA